MTTALMVMAVLGMLAMVGGGIWLVIAAFSVSALWGLMVLLLPAGSLAFVVKHWEEGRNPFFIQLGGTALFVACFVSYTARVRAERESRDGGDDAEMGDRRLGDDRGPGRDRWGEPVLLGSAGMGTASSTPAPAYKCERPSGPLPNGFASFCCTPSGWRPTGRKGCSSVYPPSDACGPQNYGASATTACATRAR
jgi:hypothetical protein